MAERNGIDDIWGSRSPYRGIDGWPERVDRHCTEEPEHWVQSACVLCSNGCGLDIGLKEGRMVGVRGRGIDTVNRGRLGPKGLNGWQANLSGDRLRQPLIREGGALRPASWNEAMELIVARSREIRDTYTASAIGFYTSGQLMLEEYYTLAVIGKAGLGTPHMDGNTRLCTATAAAALKETFGADGQPASYADIDATDCLFLVGHNVAETATVLWMRMLDRRRGPQPARMIVLDPRRTATAAAADLHLAPRVGTNVAVLNAILHRLIAKNRIDRDFIDHHTVGFDELRRTVAAWPAERASAVSGVPAADLDRAADMIGAAPSLVCTCLQGVYQSNQATAAAVQVNNIALIRGMIGRPGCGVLQMNGQPTAQNNRETGADGDLPGFRNWENPEHIAELARLWNVDPAIIPHWAPPTHALQMFHYAETGSLRMLWISATNPAVSMPQLDRVRRILRQPNLFVVVQDAFLSETAALADVVLPAALWGEKTGTFTNADRTVHIALKAIDPPGEARSDLDIFLDYAARMNFTDKDGAPLVKWCTPEQAFEAWKLCSRGRPCDYSALSYDKLRGGSGIRWPCNADHPDGIERLYADRRFPTTAGYCETYGHDLETGAELGFERHRGLKPAGRAILQASDYKPPSEEPDGAYPFMLTTGRVVHHFHTRTKTARSPALQHAAPDAFVQIASSDAARLGIADGDQVRLTSRRGTVEMAARIAEIRSGHLFVPFHYGYWDHPGHRRAANELTLFEWDPVSKQPHFKYCAVRLEPAGEVGVTHEPAETAKQDAGLRERPEPPRQHIADYIGLLRLSEARLADALDKVRARHRDVPDVERECLLFAGWSRAAEEALRPSAERFGEQASDEPRRLENVLVRQHGHAGFALLRDLQDLWLLVNESLISVEVLRQAAQALRDQPFLQVLDRIHQQNERQRAWLTTRLKQAGPQALVVPS